MWAPHQSQTLETKARIDTLKTYRN
jgi:hypothetical protein